MSLRDKVAQLIVVPIYGELANTRSAEFRKYQHLIRDLHVGGVIVTGHSLNGGIRNAEPYAMAALLNRLQKLARTPLFVAADFERGASMRVNSTTAWPYSMAFGAAQDLAAVTEEAADTARDARAMGVNWLFAPVADVNNNPDNPIINIRSFGENPQQVGELVTAYIRGARANGMLTTAKHFPGHGDTATDSHLGVAQVSGDRVRLDSVELPPFRQAIAAGVDAVMVAHVAVPALESDPNKVATTSPAIVTQLLKEQLGFHGIVISDALDMAALTRLYAANIGRAAVDAFKAGNDVLLIPPDLDAAYRAMLAAVASGEISVERLDSSVRKILEAKASLGLQRVRFVDIGTMDQIIGQPENAALAQKISDDAITVVRDNGKVLPLKAVTKSAVPLPYQAPVPITNRVVAVIFTDDVRLESGRAFERQLHIRAPDAHIFYVDSRIAEAMSADLLRAVDDAETVLAAVYAAPSPGVRGSGSAASRADTTYTLLQSILDHAAAKTALLAVGSPYAAQDFPAVQNYLCTFSSAPVSETSAVKALFGEIPIRGHLPVSIPNIAERGVGIEKAMK